MKRSIAMLALTGMILAGFVTLIEAEAGGKARLRARLRGDRTTEVRGGGGSGYASNGEGRKRMSVRVRTNLPAGRVLVVTACGQEVGTITLTARRGNRSGGRLTLSTGAQDVVPDCIAGDDVTVTGSGLTIAGVYRGRSESSP